MVNNWVKGVLPIGVPFSPHCACMIITNPEKLRIVHIPYIENVSCPLNRTIETHNGLNVIAQLKILTSIQLHSFIINQVPKDVFCYLKGRNFRGNYFSRIFFSDISQELIFANWALLRISR